MTSINLTTPIYACAILLLVLVQLSSALRFDLPAASGHGGKNERCIRNFVSNSQLVVVTANVEGERGGGQVVNMHVRVSPNIVGAVIYLLSLFLLAWI